MGARNFPYITSQSYYELNDVCIISNAHDFGHSAEIPEPCTPYFPKKLPLKTVKTLLLLIF